MPAAPEIQPSAPDSAFQVIAPWLLSTTSGVLYFLGFAGFDLWPLQLCSFVPILWVIRSEPSAKPFRMLRLGWVFGFFSQAGGYYWMVGFLENFSGFPLPISILIACLFWGAHGLQQAFFVLLTHDAQRRGHAIPVAAIVLWCGLEWITPMIFPSYLGNSLHLLPPMIQIADLGGPILLSALLILVNSAFFELFWFFCHRGSAFSKKTAFAAAVAMALTYAYGIFRISDVTNQMAQAPTMNVGLIQTSLSMKEKRRSALEGHYRHLSDSLALESTNELDLIVWPESSFNRMIPENINNFQSGVLSTIHRGIVLGPLRTPLLFGGIAMQRVEGERKLYNSAYLVDAAGDLQAVYHKQFLLAFGEYLPFGELFPILYEWSPNSGHFTPGQHFQMMPLGEHRITTLICYEDVLPNFTRRAVLHDRPHLLVNITNDSWFGDTTEPWIHLALAKFRAVEHHRSLVRATNSGVSAVVDPIGRTLSHSQVNTREAVVAEVPLLEQATVYQSVGDWPGWLGFLCSFPLLLRKRRLWRSKTA
ncbi:MAG: apolipoprotein N-acyltransferase [Myxococcota bacterium]